MKNFLMIQLENQIDMLIKLEGTLGTTLAIKKQVQNQQSKLISKLLKNVSE